MMVAAAGVNTGVSGSGLTVSVASWLTVALSTPPSCAVTATLKGMLLSNEAAGVVVRPARSAAAVAECTVSVKLPSSLAVSASPFCDRLGSPEILTVNVSAPSSVSSARLAIATVTALVPSSLMVAAAAVNTGVSGSGLTVSVASWLTVALSTPPSCAVTATLNGMLLSNEAAGVVVRPARSAAAVAECTVSVKLPSSLAVSASPFCDRLGSPEILTVNVSAPSSVSSARLAIATVTALVPSSLMVAAAAVNTGVSGSGLTVSVASWLTVALSTPPSCAVTATLNGMLLSNEAAGVVVRPARSAAAVAECTVSVKLPSSLAVSASPFCDRLGSPEILTVNVSAPSSVSSARLAIATVTALVPSSLMVAAAAVNTGVSGSGLTVSVASWLTVALSTPPSCAVTATLNGMLLSNEAAGVVVRPARSAAAVAECTVSVKLPSSLAVSASPFCDRLGSPEILTVNVSAPSSVSSARLAIATVTALVPSSLMVAAAAVNTGVSGSGLTVSVASWLTVALSTPPSCAVTATLNGMLLSNEAAGVVVRPARSAAAVAECTVSVKLPSSLAVSASPFCDRLCSPEILTVNVSAPSSVSSARLAIAMVTALVPSSSMVAAAAVNTGVSGSGFTVSVASWLTVALSTPPSCAVTATLKGMLLSNEAAGVVVRPARSAAAVAECTVSVKLPSSLAVSASPFCDRLGSPEILTVNVSAPSSVSSARLAIATVTALVPSSLMVAAAAVNTGVSGSGLTVSVASWLTVALSTPPSCAVTATLNGMLLSNEAAGVVVRPARSAAAVAECTVSVKLP